MNNITDFYKYSSKVSKVVVPGLTMAMIHQALRNRKEMKKEALLPLAPLIIGAGIGALGGAATAPKGQRLSGAITGGLFGGLTGGYGGAAMAGGKALLGGLGRAGASSAAKGALAKTIATKGAPTVGKMARGAMINTGIGASATGLMGGYSAPVSGGLRPPQGYMNRPFY